MNRPATAASAILAVAASFALASPSSAEPLTYAQLNQNCIDYHEYVHELGYGQSMHEVETITNATGRVVASSKHGRRAIAQYRWCGHASRDGFFQVSYVLTDRGYRSRADLMYDFTSHSVLQHQPEDRML